MPRLDRLPRLISALCLLISVPASAATFYTYEALLDTDNNPSTGGPVGVVQGAEAPHDEQGVDYIVRAYGVRTCTDPAAVDAVVVLKWDGNLNDFVEASSDPTGYLIGDGNGNGGTQLVEFQAPLSAFTAPSLGPVVKGVFHASRPVVFNDYTAPFLLSSLSVIEVPSLNSWGMLVATLLLALAAFHVLRRQRAGLAIVLFLFSASAALAAVFSMDGLAADWNGISPLVTDIQGDSSINDPAEDIRYGFAVRDNAFLTFRMDIDGAIQDSTCD